MFIERIFADGEKTVVYIGSSDRPDIQVKCMGRRVRIADDLIEGDIYADLKFPKAIKWTSARVDIDENGRDMVVIGFGTEDGTLGVIDIRDDESGLLKIIENVGGQHDE